MEQAAVDIFREFYSGGNPNGMSYLTSIMLDFYIVVSARFQRARTLTR